MFRSQSLRSRFGELPDILWAWFPSHPTDAGVIHPLRPHDPDLQRREARARASNFNSIAEVMVLT